MENPEWGWDRTEQCKTEWNRKAGWHRIVQYQTGPNSLGQMQGRTWQDKPAQDGVERVRKEQSRTEQFRTSQDGMGQDRTVYKKTRRDRVRWDRMKSTVSYGTM